MTEISRFDHAPAPIIRPGNRKLNQFAKSRIHPVHLAMGIIRVLQLFAFLVVTGFMLEAVYWLLNQRSDMLPMIAGLILLIYVWLTVRSKFFTKNPFTKHHHE